MRIRASILTTAVVLAISSGLACTHAGGKLMVDSPQMLPYQAPDIDEITGIDTPDAPDDAPATGSGAAQKPHK